MTKRAIAESIQNVTGLTAVMANAAADAVIESIVTTLKKEKRYTLPGFGTFHVHRIKPRKFVNPRTGEPIDTKPKTKRTVRFKASPRLRAQV